MPSIWTRFHTVARARSGRHGGGRHGGPGARAAVWSFAHIDAIAAPSGLLKDPHKSIRAPSGLHQSSSGFFVFVVFGLFLFSAVPVFDGSRFWGFVIKPSRSSSGFRRGGPRGDPGVPLNRTENRKTESGPNRTENQKLSETSSEEKKSVYPVTVNTNCSCLPRNRKHEISVFTPFTP